MFFVLHRFGNLPVKKEIFMIVVRCIFNLSLNSFRLRFGKENEPTAFLVLIWPVMLIISFSVTGCSRREDKTFIFKIIWKVLIEFWRFLINFLCYSSKKLLNSSAFLLLVVNLSFIFRKVGCSLLCFLWKWCLLFLATLSLNYIYFLENILYESFLYSFLSNLKEYFCNFWTVGVVNLFVPGTLFWNICYIFYFCFKLMSKYLLLSMVQFLL